MGTQRVAHCKISHCEKSKRGLHSSIVPNHKEDRKLIKALFGEQPAV